MSAASEMINDLPRSLEAKVADTLVSGEQTVIKLKGALKEALVCTDRRVMILKGGLWTGSAFGINLFQLPYGSVTSVDVKFSLVSGYFEISTGGVQSSEKTIWTTKPERNPSRSPNCVGLNLGCDRASFDRACTYIMERVHEQRGQGSTFPQGTLSSAGDLVKLADLYERGLLTEEEFRTEKAKLISSNNSGPIIAIFS
jgi:hypothetical protein